MSSHHFVKEGQEPALVIFDWSERIESFVSQLMAWQPKVIIDTKILDVFLSSGYKPDGVLGEVSDEYLFLEPLEKYSIEEIKSDFPRSTLIKETSPEELNALVTENKCTAYSSKYKVYTFSGGSFQKYPPYEKSIFYYKNGLKEMPKKGSFFYLENEEPFVVFEEI